MVVPLSAKRTLRARGSSDEVSAAAPSFTLNGRALIWPALFVILTLVALSAYGEVQQVVHMLAAFTPGAWVGAVALVALSFGLRAARFQLYLRDIGVRVAHREATLVFFAGMSMAFTPGRVGEIIKPLMLKWSRDVPVGRVVPIVIFERVTDLVALLVLTAWGVLVLPAGRVLCAVCIALAVVVALLFGSRWVALRMQRLIGLVPRLKQKVQGFERSVELVNQPRLVGLGSALALVAWFCQVLCLQQIVHGLPNTQITLQASALACCGPLLAGVAALVPGGIGVTEATMTGVLQAIGGSWSTAASAVAVTALVRLVTFWWAVALGFVALAVHKRLIGWNTHAELTSEAGQRA